MRISRRGWEGRLAGLALAAALIAPSAAPAFDLADDVEARVTTSSAAPRAPAGDLPPVRSAAGARRAAREAARRRPTPSAVRAPAKSDALSELTKPSYLRVRLPSTPKNHRAPPA